MRLERKVALVTGGASGIGRAVAHRLAAEGATVVITDVQAELGARVAAEHGLTFFEHDVSHEARWNEVVRQVEERFEKLDVLINNAGILGPTDVASPENTPLTVWQKIFTVNVEGVFLGCRAAIPAMRRAGGGSIVNLSSVAALMATPDATAYGASKAAVRHLTKSVAQHCALEKLNIRCNSVHPGLVRTPLWDQQAAATARLRGVSFDAVVAEGRALVPLGEFTRVEDVAAAVAFLASDEARHITGARLSVDGGIADCDTFAMMAAVSPVTTANALDSSRPL